MPPPAPPIHKNQDESISASVCAKEKNNKSNVPAKEKNNVLNKENIECVKEKIESMKESDSMQKVRATTPQVKIRLSIIHLFDLNVYTNCSFASGSSRWSIAPMSSVIALSGRPRGRKLAF